MRFCGECGTQLGENDNFCGECGAKVEREQSINKNVVYESPKNQTPKFRMTKKNKIIIGTISAVVGAVVILALVANTLTSKEKVISQFKEALETKNVSKITKFLVSSDTELKIDESTVKPLMDYIDKNPSWIEDTIKSLESQSKMENDKRILDSLLNGLDYNEITLKNNGKKFLFFNSYSFEIKPYYINVRATLKDTKIMVNDKEVCTVDSENFSKKLGPYLPGIYTVKGVYKGKYTDLEKKEEIELQNNIFSGNTKSVYLSFNEKYVKPQCDFKDAKLFANGKDTGMTVKEAQKFGPIDDSVKLQAVMDFPWGTSKSKEVSIGDSLWGVNLELSLSDDVKDAIMNTINQFDKSWIEAATSRDVSKIKCVSDKMLEHEKEYIDDMIKYKRYFKGKIIKIIYDLDSFKILNNDGKYSVSVTNSEYYDSAEYYENQNDVQTSLRTNRWKYTLVFDEQNGKWLIDSASRTYFMNDENIKEFIMDSENQENIL